MNPAPNSRLWHGVFPAVTTQFLPDGSLDLRATQHHLENLIDQGVHGLVMLGTVGENCSLEFEEKIEVLRASVERTGDRVPVLTGVAEYTPRLACRFAEAAAESGIDGLMVMPPMAYRSDPDEILHHLLAVAAATELPIMVYNNPVTYQVDITPDAFGKLADNPRFIAIKESSDDVRRITDLRNDFGNRFQLFCGVDDLALESLLLGADGWVSGLVNAFPAENRRLWDLAVAGRWDEARILYRWYTPLLHLDTQTKLVQYIKLAQSECGLGSENVRPPRLPLTGEERDRILALIHDRLDRRPDLK